MIFFLVLLRLENLISACVGGQDQELDIELKFELDIELKLDLTNILSRAQAYRIFDKLKFKIVCRL